MKLNFAIRKLFALFLFALLLFCCKDKQRDPIEIETEEVAILLKKHGYNNEHVEQPEELKAICQEKQRTVKDSTNYYRLAEVIALCDFYSNRLDTAMNVFNSIFDFCNKKDSTDIRIATLEAHSYIDMGSFYTQMEKTDSSLYYLQKGVNAAKRQDNVKLEAVAYINIAANQYQTGNYAMAASNYRNALLVIDTLDYNNKKTLDRPCYFGLARLYTDLENYTLSDHYFSILENKLDEMSDFDRLIFLTDKGHYHYKKKEYEEALNWFYKSHDISRNLKSDYFVAISGTNIGETYLYLNKTDSAEAYLNKAADFFLSLDDTQSSAHYVNGLIGSLNIQKNNLAEAERILSRKYDESSVDPIYLQQNYKRLEELYEKKGDFKRAYSYGKKSASLNDSIRNATVQNNIAEIDMRYAQDTTLMRRDIVIAQKEQKVSQLQSLNILIVSLLVIVVLTAVLIVVYLRRRKDRRYARQVATITSLRMENVRNRISPHYMFNVLNSIIPSINDQQNLSQPMSLLIDSIRGNLLISEKMAVTLAEETTIVKNYIALQENISTKTPQIKWNVAKDVDENILLPSMVIQIPVENAIKYAFEDYSPDNLISINISRIDDAITIIIKDNGLGFSSDRYIDKKKGTGSGLRILFKTIELLNSKNQQKIEFSIIDMKNKSGNDHGTEVSILIPLRYKYEL